MKYAISDRHCLCNKHTDTNYSDCTHYLCATEISFDVELREQEEEHDSMTSNPPHEGTRVMTLSEAELKTTKGMCQTKYY